MSKHKRYKAVRSPWHMLPNYASRWGRWPTYWYEYFDCDYKGGRWREEFRPAGLNWYEAAQ